MIAFLVGREPELHRAGRNIHFAPRQPCRSPNPAPQLHTAPSGPAHDTDVVVVLVVHEDGEPGLLAYPHTGLKSRRVVAAQW